MTKVSKTRQAVVCLARQAIDQVQMPSEEFVEIITSGETPKTIKHALKAHSGSLEEPARLAFGVEIATVLGAFDKAVLETFGKELMDWPSDPFEQKWAEDLHESIQQLQDVEQWEELAAHDSKAYSKTLDKVLGDIKRMMNARVGIEAHAPRKKEYRDELIFLLKFLHPDWSFGQVAREYGNLTGNPINPENEKSDPKWAQLIYKKRCEQKVDDVIAFMRRDFNPFRKMKTLYQCSDTPRPQD